MDTGVVGEDGDARVPVARAVAACTGSAGRTGRTGRLDGFLHARMVTDHGMAVSGRSTRSEKSRRRAKVGVSVRPVALDGVVRPPAHPLSFSARGVLCGALSNCSIPLRCADAIGDRIERTLNVNKPRDYAERRRRIFSKCGTVSKGFASDSTDSPSCWI